MFAAWLLLPSSSSYCSIWNMSLSSLLHSSTRSLLLSPPDPDTSCSSPSSSRHPTHPTFDLPQFHFWIAGARHRPPIICLGESNKRLSGKVDERGLVPGWRLIEVDNGTGPPLPLPPFIGRVTGRPQMCHSGELNGCCMAGSRSACVGRNYICHKSIG